MNHVTFIGRLTKDPEKKTYLSKDGEKAFVTGNIAVTRTGDRKRSDFFNFTAFGGTAKVIYEYVKKGHLVCLSGEMENNNYTTKDGTKRYDTVLNVRSVDLLNPKEKSPKEKSPEYSSPEPERETNRDTGSDPIQPDEIPF